MKHHRLALAAWGLSWLLAAAGGLLFGHFEHVGPAYGLYWAVGVVTTSGGDLLPTNAAAYWVAGFTKLLAIPVYSIAVALLYSWITSLHVGRAAREIKAHVTSEVSSGRP